MTAAENQAQFYLDKQGYIVIAGFVPHERGTVISAECLGELVHSLVVTGPATRAEYVAQCVASGASTRLSKRTYFHKAVAE